MSVACTPISMEAMVFLSAVRLSDSTLWKNSNFTPRFFSTRYIGAMMVSPVPASKVQANAPM